MMRTWLWLALCCVALSACGSEDPRTQITLMIDADPGVKADVDSVQVRFASAPRGSRPEDFVARSPQEFATPIQWPIVIVLVPSGDDADRAFQIDVEGRAGSVTSVEASARSHFLKGKHLALRMRLHDVCRASAFAGCDDGETCVPNAGTARCDDNEIDPRDLPAFDGVDPSSDAGIDASDANVSTPRDVVGRVFSTQGLSPLQGAEVSVASGETAITNSDGEFTISALSNDASITVQHPDHAIAIKPLPGAASVYLELFLKQVDVRQSLASTVGGAVKTSDGAGAVFPPTAFKRPNGDVESGMAEVTLAAPNTKDPAQAQSFPSDFKAVESGREGSFAAESALDVSAQSASGKLDINDSTEVEISLPAKTSGAASTIDLWSFDDVRQAWTKEGQATLTQDAMGNVVYRAKITHLSWWAVGTLIEDVTCAHLCATYQGTAAPYARATVTGISEAFQGTFFADDSGCVAFDVPRTTQVSIHVQSIDGASAPQVIITSGTAGTSTDIGTCQDLGTITLAPRTASSCPSGRSACSDGCTDTASDRLNCGACGAQCGASETCIAGACACTSTQTDCNSACVNTQTDALHCGTCDTACTPAQRCNQGRCVDVSCPAMTTNCGGLCVAQSDLTNGFCPGTTPPDCRGPQDCPSDRMCGFDGQCGPFTTCTSDSACPNGYRCSIGGLCEIPNCGMVGYTWCPNGISCVNLDTNPTSCGACGYACGSGQTCEAGSCTTCTTMTSCMAMGANCGSIADGCGGVLDCGTCAVMGETCGGGGTPNVCGSIPSLCGDGVMSGTEQCDDGGTSSADGCSSTCTIEVGFVCPMPGSPCIPAGSADLCDGIDNDDDTAIDEDFVSGPCGVSGGECVAGTTACLSGTSQCTGGVGPVAELCDGLDNDCDGTIDNGFSFNNDVNNCGGCGFVCGTQGTASSVCMGGSCNIVCQGGRGNCDGNSANGCEVNLLTDPGHCSTCGFVCGSGMCLSGTCLP